MTPILDPARVRELLGTPPKQEGHRRLDNLGRWVTTKLTPEQRARIREAHERGEKCELIARRYGVSIAYVSMIGTGKRRVA